MKLLLVSQNYEPEVCGAAIRLRNMVNGLKKEGVEIDVLTAMPNYPTGKIFDGYKGKFTSVEQCDNGKIFRYWLVADKSYNKVKRLFSIITLSINLMFFGFRRRHCKSYDAVIVQTPQLITAFCAVVLFHKLYKKRIFLNVSDIHPNSIEDGGSFPKDGFMYKWQRGIEKFLYRNTDLLIGQSEEIITHANEYRMIDSFLYRNLQSMEGNVIIPKSHKGSKIIYAGLLSKTQGVLSIIEHVDFASLGLEFHIYGNGNEKEAIQQRCDNKSVFYHGVIPNSQMFAELQKYDASIVPLSRALKGAVPSKVYNVIAAGMPLFFMGKEDGEAASIVRKYNVGWVSPTNDFKSLRTNLEQFCSISDEDYFKKIDNCKQLSQNEFNLEAQLNRLIQVLHKQIA